MRRFLIPLLFLAGLWSLRAETSVSPAATVDPVTSLQNSRLQFERTLRGNVAFLGGSITEMEGYRPRVCAALRARFPDTVFTFTNAGISSTCSNTGAFRLDHDVLSRGPVDLLVVEFAVNDDQDGGFSRTQCIRGLEGVVRHALQANPYTDVLVVYFVNQAHLQAYQAGKTPLAISAHAAVADYYRLPTINVAEALAAAIGRGEMTWQKYGGVHPGPAGADFCAQLFSQLFQRAWNGPVASDARVAPHAVPERPLDPYSYSRGEYIAPDRARVGSGWVLGVPDWGKLAGSKRERFTSVPMLSADTPGAALTLKFSGSAVGAYIVSGPDAGVVEASIDGGPARRIVLKTPHSGGLHYPWTVMFADELPPTDHILDLRIADEPGSGGHAMRIMQFAVNPR